METDKITHAERLVGKYTEIMPARPTISHHRHPYDSVKKPLDNKKADLVSKLDVCIITAAEQQTMNYYMNLGGFYENKKGRELYAEIAMVEEQHVTHYGSLIDPTSTPFEELLMHEYVECYLYYSMYNDESDERIKNIYEMLLEQEIAHLHTAVKLLQKYEKKARETVISDGTFPELVKLHENKEYIRTVLSQTVNMTADKEGYINVAKLPDNADFFKYQQKVIQVPEKQRSHLVITDNISEFKQDYRYQEKEHPIKALRQRTSDNIEVGRVK